MRDNGRGVRLLVVAVAQQDVAEDALDARDFLAARPLFRLATDKALRALELLTDPAECRRAVRVLTELMDGSDFTAQELRRQGRGK